MFLANTGIPVWNELTDVIFRDKHLYPTLLEKGFIQFGKETGGGYDPIQQNAESLTGSPYWVYHRHLGHFGCQWPSHGRCLRKEVLPTIRKLTASRATVRGFLAGRIIGPPSAERLRRERMRLTKPQIVICFVMGIVMTIAGYISAVHMLSLTREAMILLMAGVLVRSILSLMAMVVFLNFVSDHTKI